LLCCFICFIFCWWVVLLCSRFACTFFRACRLKKKAQHEANKVKLQGLELEQREYLLCLHVHEQQGKLSVLKVQYLRLESARKMCLQIAVSLKWRLRTADWKCNADYRPQTFWVNALVLPSSTANLKQGYSGLWKWKSALLWAWIAHRLTWSLF